MVYNAQHISYKYQSVFFLNLVPWGNVMALGRNHFPKYPCLYRNHLNILKGMNFKDPFFYFNVVLLTFEVLLDLFKSNRDTVKLNSLEWNGLLLFSTVITLTHYCSIHISSMIPFSDGP